MIPSGVGGRGVWGYAVILSVISETALCLVGSEKMLLSVQKEFLRYSIWNLQQIQNLNRIKNLSLEGPFSSNTIIRKQSKENNGKCLEIMEESLLLLSLSSFSVDCWCFLRGFCQFSGRCCLLFLPLGRPHYYYRVFLSQNK